MKGFVSVNKKRDSTKALSNAVPSFGDALQDLHEKAGLPKSANIDSALDDALASSQMIKKRDQKVAYK